MYKLYYDSGGSNMAPHAALKEIGAPHELVRVDLDKGEQHSAAYLKLNPHGRVPTLVHGDLVIYESAAILLYLCDRHPEAGLAPPPDRPERGLFLQWLVYQTNTVQEALLQWFHPDLYAPDPGSQIALKSQAAQRLDSMWRYLDGVLAEGGPYLLGERFSACDLFLHMLTRWSRNLQTPATAHPGLRRCFDLVGARPAVQAMMRAEGIA